MESIFITEKLAETLQKASNEKARQLEQQRLESSSRLANRLSRRKRDKCGVTEEAVNELSSTVFSYLNKMGGNINREDNLGSTIVHFAAADGCRRDIEFLISLGATINKRNNDGNSALWIAAWKGHVEVVSCLCEYGADIDSQDNDGWTPLYVAASSGQTSVIQVLLFYGANINTPEHDGRSPLYIAALMGHLDIVCVLCEFGADIDACDHSKWSPIWVAARYGHMDVVHKLLFCGASIQNFYHKAKLLSPLLVAPISDVWTSLEALKSTTRIAFSYKHHRVRQCDAQVSRGVDEEKLFEAFSIATSITSNVRHSCPRTNSTKPLPTSTTKTVPRPTSSLYSIPTLENFKLSNEDTPLVQVQASLMHHLLSLDAATEVQALVRVLEHNDFSYQRRRQVVSYAKTTFVNMLREYPCSFEKEGTRYRAICELVALYYDRDMLEDVMNLRLVSKSCNSQRRFPVSKHIFLEQNMIEDYVAYEITRHVPTSFIIGALFNRGSRLEKQVTS